MSDCEWEVAWAVIMGCVRVSGVWQTDGCTPLYAASFDGHVEVVRALVGAGAAVNQARVRDDWWVLGGFVHGVFADGSFRVAACAVRVWIHA